MVNSALIDFLKKDYPTSFDIDWDEATMQIRKEQRSKGKFEIRDQQSTIVQYCGKGVSVINNRLDINVEIVDFERYIDLFKNTEAGKGQKCDFIINPVAGYDFIVFNELTESKNQYLLPFSSSVTGGEKEGKLSYAKKQLEVSIERFYSINNFLDNYKKKIALFSCRLTDGKSSRVMTRSVKAFRKPQRILSNIRGNELLVHGFVFELRIYDQEYKIS